MTLTILILKKLVNIFKISQLWYAYAVKSFVMMVIKTDNNTEHSC